MASSKELRYQDPFLLREGEKYENPLPSREWVISILELEGVPLSFEELIQKLSIKKHEINAFNARLKAMVRNGQIYINRAGFICVADKIELIQCRVEGHKDGFGFAVPLEDDGASDFLLSEKKMRALMDGDIISMKPTGFDRRGRREGRVLEILERQHKELVVRLYIEQGIVIGIPEEKRITQTILLPSENGGDKNKIAGQVAVVAIDQYPHGVTLATGHITEILGGYADPGMEIDIAVRKHQLSYQFSKDCLKEVQLIPQEVGEEEISKRKDLRHLAFVTIDGETARDFDDAVYAEKKGGNHTLWVAIADVSHYVKTGSFLDEDAYDRATSVYFPRRVIPMLPEALSNGICSLNPEVDRLCMVCEMKISSSGEVLSYEFYQATIRSHARLTYDEVWKNKQESSSYPFKKEIDVLYDLYQILLKNRFSRGALEFDGQETQMIFDQNNKIKKIIPVFRNDIHRLIEECMLAANVCAADFIEKNDHDGLYRVHLGPTAEKLLTLREQLSLLGLSLEGKDKPTPKDYAKLFEQINLRADKQIIQIMLLRSMQQAVYQKENLGHFGLSYEAYTHFTSPIRRYPDLLVHRVIKALLAKQSYIPKKSWQEMGVHCSSRERKAEEASRDVEKWLKTYYMVDKVGEIFEGTITSLTSFGVFVSLKDIYIEGMVHISELGQDYFHYHSESLSIIGERTNLRFKLGDPMIVKVAQADLDTCRIDLVLVSGGKKEKKNNSKQAEYKKNKKKKIIKKGSG